MNRAIFKSSNARVGGVPRDLEVSRWLMHYCLIRIKKLKLIWCQCKETSMNYNNASASTRINARNETNFIFFHLYLLPTRVNWGNANANANVMWKTKWHRRLFQKKKLVESWGNFLYFWTQILRQIKGESCLERFGQRSGPKRTVCLMKEYKYTAYTGTLMQ